jgi:hypothetical protein
MNEQEEKQLLKKISPYCYRAWINHGKLSLYIDHPLQLNKLSQLLNRDPIPGDIPNHYLFDISDLDVNQIKGY